MPKEEYLLAFNESKKKKKDLQDFRNSPFAGHMANIIP